MHRRLPGLTVLVRLPYEDLRSRPLCVACWMSYGLAMFLSSQGLDFKDTTLMPTVLSCTVHGVGLGGRRDTTSSYSKSATNLSTPRAVIDDDTPEIQISSGHVHTSNRSRRNVDAIAHSHSNVNARRDALDKRTIHFNARCLVASIAFSLG